MDFHSLSRRDLQALSKKNKIPANITNVAMAEALKALETVEGIEELMQPSQSGTAPSSVEPLEMPEVTSPSVPPTGGRSTRRTNTAKEAVKSVNPMTRTRRTARKTQVKDADALETPALTAHTNRKIGQMASARRNMDSQFKECENEDKKEFPLTPAPMGGTSRRRRVEEGEVKKVYSTRRSAKLTQKSSVEIADEVENADTEEMNLNDGVDNFNELSDVDAITTVDEKSENKDESKVASIGKDEFEVGSDQKQDTSVVKDEFEAEKSSVENANEVENADTEEMNLDDGVDNFNVLSDVDAITTVDEKSEKKDESEVVSIGKDEFEVGPDQKQDNSVVKDEPEMVSDQKQETSAVKDEFEAEKSGVEIANEVENADTEELNLNDGVDNFDELTCITDVDAIATIDQKSENKDESEVVSIGKDEFEVVSDQKQDTSVAKAELEAVSDHKQDESIGEEMKMGSNAEKEKCSNFEMEAKSASVVKDEFEAVLDHKHDESIGEEIKMCSYAEEEECTNFETEAKPEEEKCDIEEDMPLKVSNEVQQNDGSQDLEIEITVEKSTEELKPEEGEASQDDEAADFVENVILETGDEFVVDESSCNNTCSLEEIKEELNSDIIEECPKGDSNFIDHLVISMPNEMETLHLEEIEKSVHSDEPHADQIPKSAVDVEVSHPTCFEGLENEPNEIETLQLEEIEKAADSLQSDEPYADDSFEQIAKTGEDVEISNQGGFQGLNPHVITVQHTCSTPSKASTTKKGMMTVFSDNKENIGGNLVITRGVKMDKKSVQNVENLDEFSVRKLTKMLKEKLEITKKSSKNENDNEAMMSRPALQVLPENRLVDDAQT